MYHFEFIYVCFVIEGLLNDIIIGAKLLNFFGSYTKASCFCILNIVMKHNVMDQLCCISVPF